MFCRYCGKEMSNDTQYCSECGKRANEGTTNQSGYTYNAVGQGAMSGQAMLQKFSERVKINAIIWLVVAIIQILLGLYVQWVLIIVGVLNLVTAITDLNYSKSVLQRPTGIISRMRPIVLPIVILIYNFVYGGLIGVVGSIYYLIAVRGFVIENELHFRKIEEECGTAFRKGE